MPLEDSYCSFIILLVAIGSVNIQSSLCLTEADLVIFTDLPNKMELFGTSDFDVYSDTSLACATRAPPDVRPLYVWFVKNSTTPLPVSVRGHFTVKNGFVFASDETVRGGILIISNLSFIDSGKYRCEAQELDQSTMEIVTVSITLTLKLLVRLEPVSPTIRTFNDSQYVRIGCDMAGYIRPDNDLFWIINGQPVLYMTNNSSKYSISYSDGDHVAQFGGNSTVPSRVSWLTVFDVELSDANNQYVCAINNTEHRANVTLEVHKASSPSGFPTDIQATAVSSTTIRVEWNNVEEAERNGNITHFEIIISLPSSAAVNESNITVQVSWKDRDFMFDDLEEFTEYNVSLRAFTVVGPGPFSPHLGVQTLEDVPSGHPQDVRAIPISPSAINVSWSAVPERYKNGIITKYEVEVNQSSFQEIPYSQTVDIVDASSTGVLMENLEEFVEYSVRVRAHTAVGSGPFSSFVIATTEEARPTSSPQIMSLMSFNSSALGLIWSRPSEIQVNGLLRHYIIKYCTPIEAIGTTEGGEEGSGSGFINPDMTLVSSDESMNCSSTNVSGDVTREILTELDGNTIYTVSVAAVTIAEGPFAMDTIWTGNTLIEVKPSSHISLGPDSLVSHVSIVCTIRGTANLASDSVFIWLWSTSTGSNYKEVTDLDTRASTLKISNLRYEDAGSYKCGLFFSDWDTILVNSSFATLKLNYEIKTSTPSILVTGDETAVDLVCNFYGYLPTDKLSWYHQTQEVESIREVVVGIRQVLDEAHRSQTGGERPGSGLQSILTISSPTVDHAGRYYCALPNDLRINATIDLVIPPSVEPDDPTNVGVTIGVLVAVVIIVLLIFICITMIIFGTCLVNHKRDKRPSIQEHNTVAALEDFVSVNEIPAEKISLGSIDVGENLLEPIEYSTPLIPGDRTRLEKEPEANGHLTVGGQSSTEQIPKLDLVEQVSEECPQYNTVTETSQSAAGGEEDSVADVNNCALGHSDPVDMETEKHKLLETFESDLLGEEVATERVSPEEVSPEGVSQEEVSPEEVSPENMKDTEEESVQELAPVNSNPSYIETDV